MPPVPIPASVAAAAPPARATCSWRRLAACAQLTCQMVAANMGLDGVTVAVTVEGDLDLRGTLGTADVPVGFEAIRVEFGLTGDVPPDRLAKLKERTERYCVVLQTLLAPPRIDASWAAG